MSCWGCAWSASIYFLIVVLGALSLTAMMASSGVEAGCRILRRTRSSASAGGGRREWHKCHSRLLKQTIELLFT